MEIAHIAMYVEDLEGAKTFFETYFGAEPGGLYHNRNTGFRSYFLAFGSGARLEIMNRPGLAADTEGLRKGYIHMAFPAGQCGMSGRADGTPAGGRIRSPQRAAHNGRRIL